MVEGEDEVDIKAEVEGVDVVVDVVMVVVVDNG